MNSLTNNFISNIAFNGEQLQSLRVLGEYKGKEGLYHQYDKEVLQNLKQVAEIESTESSNRIEGIFSSPDRIKGLVLKTTEPRDRSEQEIAGYRDALALIHDNFEKPDQKYMEFTVNVMLQLHSMIYRYLPQDGGKWKNTDNTILEKNVDGTHRVRFQPTSAHLTPGAMDELVKNYKFLITEGKHEPLVIIPLAILDFLCIHPFTDGNGRMARLITLQLLYTFDHRIGRFISLERVIEETKKTYYEALETSSFRWHEGKHDPMPWINYFWGVLIRAYKELEERIGNLEPGKGPKKQLIIQAIEKQMKPFAVADIEQECHGISREMIKVVLRQLKDEGKISPIGKGRGAKWVKNSQE